MRADLVNKSLGPISYWLSFGEPLARRSSIAVWRTAPCGVEGYVIAQAWGALYYRQSKARILSQPKAKFGGRGC